MLGVLGRTGRTDDGGVHDGSGAHLQASSLQHLADRGEQLFAQLVLLEQAPELQQRGAIGHTLAAQVDAHEAAQCGAVEQRLFAGLIGQVEPVLHEVHAQHALESHGRAPVAGLRVVRLDDFAQCRPGDDLVHRRQKHIALGGAAVALESGALVGCGGKGLLLHRR